MNVQHKETGVSRRSLLKMSAAVLAGGAAAGAMGAYAAAAPAAGKAPTAPPLPWKWVKLDPLEAGRRAYRYYPTKGGCGSASYLAFLSLLKEKVGYPYTTLPDMMMIHAGSGYGGHGTLCGALGGTSLIINLVTYDPKNQIFKQMIDRLFWWYAEQDFPTSRFDDISPMPGQVKARAMSPLCHTSVSKWTLTAGAEVTSKQKIERCAKVAGEVVYITTRALNEYFDGKWTPPVWRPSKQIEHCLQCHGPENFEQTTSGMNNQQGHMECLMCHVDHVKGVSKK
ncbi:MAG TPA: C-GCAxxG-C-C family protein [Syntrophales bacterium]|mgnify:CR=1 FL=1|nr:C-GCAxxG-C-C family protein [Syntrophales bacterium]HOX93640.1 C-GCAxxG-C-C family protein [Syntrophales bacterium]HPI57837.1 C-GCAxxG-C-C family protein [Syntrophales bacterium]HPN25551.1 C-GCAxxG-C-C family protein [Syntrophales bacterium]HQM28497.1 C-GCAxxG-C-C family protein [Syntrophales bacterium]